MIIHPRKNIIYRYDRTDTQKPIHPRKNIISSPLTEEIRLEIFGFPDLSVFLRLLSDEDSVYTLENLYEKLGTPVKTCLICKGTPVKTCRNFW